MGHVPNDGFEVETDLILYDGAGTRIQLGSNIGVVTPANRFQDGDDVAEWLVWPDGKIDDQCRKTVATKARPYRAFDR